MKLSILEKQSEIDHKMRQKKQLKPQAIQKLSKLFSLNKPSTVGKRSKDQGTFAESDSASQKEHQEDVGS